MKPRIAFLGLGIMGLPMATKLLEAGYPLTVWNRSPEKAASLTARGARLAESPAAAAARAEVVFTMLSDGAAVAEVLYERGLAAALAPGALMIECSSIDLARTRTHAAGLKAAGVGHLDAPVSGGPSGAARASLAIMVGGDAGDFARGAPILTHLGRPTHVGPTGAGQLAKLSNQIIVGLAIGAIAEGLLLASRGGADPAAVRRAMAGGFADSLILQIHGERMIERRFQPGGPARMHLKDMDNVLAAARELGLTLPLAERVRDLFAGLIDHGGGDYDHSAILLEIEAMSPAARLGNKPDILPT